MHRSAGILLLFGIVVAGCATTPSPLPGVSEPVRSSSPSAVISATPSAPPTATPVSTSIQTTTPTFSPIAGGWPYIADIGDLVFGPDGTVYLLAGTQDGQNQYQQSLVALDPAGYVKPGWPIAEPPGADYGSLKVGPDGSAYIEECGGREVGCVLHRLGADGRELPGWPFQVPPASVCLASDPCVSYLVIGSDGTVYLVTWDKTRGQQQIIAIDGAGKVRTGWPVALDDEYGWWSYPQVVSDGTLFIEITPSEADDAFRLWALAPDGSPRPGWPLSVPTAGRFQLGPEGTVVVVSYEPLVDPSQGGLCGDASRTVFTVLGPDGRTLTGWPRGSTRYASSPVVDPDGTA